MRSRTAPAPHSRRVLAVVGAVAALLALLVVVALWVWSPSAEPPTPAVEPEPETARTTDEASADLFASDEEALAAARATYEGALAAADNVGSDSRASLEVLDIYSVASIAESDRRDFEIFRDKGLRAEGKTEISAFEFQSYSHDTHGEISIAAYACVSVANMDVLDSAGASIVEPTRPDTTPFEIRFVESSMSPTGLQVASRTVWEGPGIC